MVCGKKKNFKSYITNPTEGALSPSIIIQAKRNIIVILGILKEAAKVRTLIKSIEM